jgi:hypothetical protein
VTCGKSNCKKCPHGPYWYARIKLSRYRNPDGTLNQKESKEIYIGKTFRFLKGDSQIIISTSSPGLRKNTPVMSKKDVHEF